MHAPSNHETMTVTFDALRGIGVGVGVGVGPGGGVELGAEVGSGRQLESFLAMLTVRAKTPTFCPVLPTAAAQPAIPGALAARA